MENLLEKLKHVDTCGYCNATTDGETVVHEKLCAINIMIQAVEADKAKKKKKK